MLVESISNALCLLFFAEIAHQIFFLEKEPLKARNPVQIIATFFPLQVTK